MKCVFLLLVMLPGINSFGQSAKHDKPSLPKNIMYILDNKVVTKDALKDIDRDAVLSVTILKDSDAVKITKDESTYAVISVTSVEYGKAHHLDYLKSKSKEFADAYSSIQNPDSVVFIWNGEVLAKRKENMLYFIGDENFIDVKTIDKNQLITDFGITDKQLGFVVNTKKSTKQ